jgi:hypothetical protein
VIGSKDDADSVMPWTRTTVSPDPVRLQAIEVPSGAVAAYWWLIPTLSHAHLPTS